jgi:hypothetical protein
VDASIYYAEVSKDPATAIEKILSDADALIRRRMKALGIEAHHVILAIAPDDAGIIRSNIGADGLTEMAAVLKDIAEQAGTPTDSDTKH